MSFKKRNSAKSVVKRATLRARGLTSIGSVYWDVNVAGLSSPWFAPRKLFRNEPSNAHHKLLAGTDPSYLLTRSCLIFAILKIH